MASRTASFGEICVGVAVFRMAKGTVDDYLKNARPVSRLDFVIVSDHGFASGAPWRVLSLGRSSFLRIAGNQLAGASNRSACSSHCADGYLQRDCFESSSCSFCKPATAAEK